MAVYQLSEEAVKATERLVGLPIEKIKEMSDEEKIAYVEEVRGEPLSWQNASDEDAVQPRGNIPSIRKRFSDRADLDEREKIITDRGRA